MRQEAQIFGAETATLPDPASGEAPIQCRVIEKHTTFDHEAPHWTILNKDPFAPSQDYAWLSSSAEFFSTGQSLNFVVTGGSQPSALAPLVKNGRFFPRLECLGSNDLFEPIDFPHTDAAAISALARAVARLGYPIYLNRVHPESTFVHSLREAYRRRGTVLTRPAGAYPWIPLESIFPDPEAALSASGRANLTRARQSANTAGYVTFEALSPHPAELEFLLDEACRIEAAAPDGGNRSAFIHRYAQMIRHKERLRLFFMRIDGRAVAVKVAVECGNRLWLLKTAHDGGFSYCEPDALLMTETMRYAGRHGLESVEIIGPHGPWIRMWPVLERPCISVRAYPASLRGLARLGCDGARYVWTRLGRN